VDERKEAWQADDGTTQDVDEGGHSTGECEDWMVYFRPVKYDNSEANAMNSDVFKVKTVW